MDYACRKHEMIKTKVIGLGTSYQRQSAQLHIHTEKHQTINLNYNVLMLRLTHIPNADRKYHSHYTTNNTKIDENDNIIVAE